MLTPETIKQIEQEAKDMAIECPDYELGYVDGATSYATLLSQSEEQNNLLRDAISSSDTIIEGLEQSIKLKEEENMRLRASLETMKSIIEQDLIANGNNDLGNRLHIEICVGLKTNTQ